MSKQNLTFHASTGCVMTLTADGRLIPGEGLSQDEATLAMFLALQELWARNAPASVVEQAALRRFDRLEGSIARLCDALDWALANFNPPFDFDKFATATEVLNHRGNLPEIRQPGPDPLTPPTPTI